VTFPAILTDCSDFPALFRDCRVPIGCLEALQQSLENHYFYSKYYNKHLQLQCTDFTINWNGDFATEVGDRVCENVKKVFELKKQPWCLYRLCFGLSFIHLMSQHPIR